MSKQSNKQQAHELLKRLLKEDETSEAKLDLRTLSPHLLGALGEEIAAWYLDERGYAIVERNYRCAEGEADIVAVDEDNSEVVLVEVKTRRERIDLDAVYPEESVSPKKQRRYRRIAYCYAAEHYPVPAVRFDVVAVGIDPDSSARRGTIHHICRAFDWEADQ